VLLLDLEGENQGDTFLPANVPDKTEKSYAWAGSKAHNFCCVVAGDDLYR
jgi:hypothetical protein